MRKAKTTKVTLRFRMLSTGKETLYLDYYPAVINPENGNPMRREYLGMYVFPLKKKSGELLVSKDGFHKYNEQDEDIIRLAEIIRNNRQNELSKSEIYTDVEADTLKAKERSQGDFIAYFADICKTKNAWNSVLNHLNDYVLKFDKSSIKRFCDIDLLWCEQFREHLLNTKTHRSDKVLLSTNTASSYFVKFKIALKSAHRHGYLLKDINQDLKSIKEEETQREFLTLEELKVLVITPCTNPVLKRAALFSALTGLRHSDIRKMRWSEIVDNNGEYSLKYIIQKTNKPDELPISNEAMHLCGERGASEDLVFEDLKYSAYANKALAQWLGSAGITRNITFHCFRHTFATLQLASGTQITTIQKMLGHKNIGTTMVYAKTLEKAKREATERIKIL